MIKLSIILPCYNVAEYLPSCIDSICGGGNSGKVRSYHR